MVVGCAAKRPFFAVRNVFDVDWDLDEDGRIVLPVLGSDDDAADLTVDGELLRLGDLAFPIAPGTAGGTGPEVHDRQHYRLVGWRNGVCGYRRFFSITSLAGLRQEDPAVFDATHAEVGRWFAEGSSTACASTTPTACPIRAAIWPGCANSSARTPGS